MDRHQLFSASEDADGDGGPGDLEDFGGDREPIPSMPRLHSPTGKGRARRGGRGICVDGVRGPLSLKTSFFMVFALTSRLGYIQFQ